MSENNNLQKRLLEATTENNRQLERIADCLDEFLGMINGVQPKELAEMAKKHKQERANARRKKK